MLKILIVAVLLVGVASAAVPLIDDPDVLKVYIVRDGATFAIVALQNEDGQWVVGFTDLMSQSYYLGNETGAVKIT
jgi:hypothetical protein